MNVNKVSVGKFNLTIAPVTDELLTEDNSYYLILLTEKKNQTDFYVSLSKDARFSDFKPQPSNRGGDDLEAKYFLENNRQEMPLWQVRNSTLKKLINFCTNLH